MGKHKSSHPFSAHDMITGSSAAAHSSLTLIPLPKPTIRRHSPNILTTPPQGRAAKAAELGTSIRRTVESLVPSSADGASALPMRVPVFQRFRVSAFNASWRRSAHRACSRCPAPRSAALNAWLPLWSLLWFLVRSSGFSPLPSRL